ncbi:MAG: hypothetical protein Q4C49_08535 [Bacillota bacterium]|nr:hypothetical protein [Bacillota bacterium]
MEKNKYLLLKEQFGHVGSFCLWSLPTHGLKSNTFDLSVFEQDDIETILTDKVVWVDMYGSKEYQNRRDGRKISWMNFHSDKARQNDYKLRFALQDTSYWGSYITPLWKNTNISLEENLILLEKELSILNPKIIVALGGNVYKALREQFSNQYKILVVKQPSFDIKVEEYRNEILEKLADY